MDNKVNKDSDQICICTVCKGSFKSWHRYQNPNVSGFTVETFICPTCHSEKEKNPPRRECLACGMG